MRITLVNWSTTEILEFDCLGWEVKNYQFFFYQDELGKVAASCYGTKNWDVRNIEY